jgi:hypothetical protein
MLEKDREETFDKLLICLSDISEEEKRDKLSRFSPSEWQDIWEEAKRQEVLPILYHIVKKMNLPIPQNLLAEGERTFLQSALSNSLLLIELKEILKRLNAKGVSVILLKGMHWAVVGKNIGLRAMGDIDLLVQARDLEKTEEELLSMGYEPHLFNPLPGGEIGHHLTYSSKEKGFFLNIHWLLLPSHYPFPIETDELWERAKKVELEGIPCLTLSPADFLVHLCLHIGAHIRTGYFTLRWLNDFLLWIKEYGENTDWQNLFEIVQRWKASRPVYLALRLAVELLKAKIPPDWLFSIKPEDFSEEYLQLARNLLISEISGNHNPHPLAVRIAYGKGWRNKFTSVIRRLFPPKELISIHYKIPHYSPLIYLFYPVYWFQKIPKRTVEFIRCLLGFYLGDKGAREAINRAKISVELEDWLMKQ